MDVKNVLHRYSSALAIACSAILVLIGGWLTRWRWNPVFYLFAGVGLMWFFARVFYGFAAARAEEAEPSASDSGRIVGALFGPDRGTGLYTGLLTPELLVQEAEAENQRQAKDTSA